MTEADRNAAVTFVEGESTGRHIRCAVAVDLHAHRAVSRQLELWPDRKSKRRALERQIPSTHAIQSHGGADITVQGCPAQHPFVDTDAHAEKVAFGKLRFS